jgi:hypothetical protein
MVDRLPLSQVVELSKTLPAPTLGVEHHTVTRGPPFCFKFHRFDPEKLAVAKEEFLQQEKRRDSETTKQSMSIPPAHGAEARRLMEALWRL